MSNVVKLRGWERVVVEQFQHEFYAGTWHFNVTVWEANAQDISESYQRLKPEEVKEYLAGDLNLVRLKVEACIEPVILSSAVSPPVWIDGQTFTGGKIRGEAVSGKDSTFLTSLFHQAIRNSMETLSDVLGRLGISEAKAEVERKAGIR